jgi:hyperosmotically inducible periplasmic protein
LARYDRWRSAPHLQAFIGKIDFLARILLGKQNADFRIDMRNMPDATRRWLMTSLMAFLSVSVLAVTAGCKSTSTAATDAAQPANATGTAGASANDDAALAMRVKSALSADPNLRPLPVSVATYRGMVQLSGYVNSEDQIQRALALARAVPGVQSVNNDLLVRPR